MKKKHVDARCPVEQRIFVHVPCVPKRRCRKKGCVEFTLVGPPEARGKVYFSNIHALRIEDVTDLAWISTEATYSERRSVGEHSNTDHLPCLEDGVNNAAAIEHAVALAE